MTVLPPPRAIIFDWDNTLVDTWPVIHDALNATFADMGRAPWTFEETRRKVKHSMRDSFPVLFGDQWQVAGELYRSHYRARHLQSLKPLPQALEVLQHIHDSGLYNVVVSNKLGPSLRQEAEHLGWNNYFNKIIGSDDALRDKPHADPVHLAFDRSPLQPGHDIWFIGDSEVDLECAQKTGCTAILYGESARDQPEYSNTHYFGFPYHAHVHGHKELLALLSFSK